MNSANRPVKIDLNIGDQLTSISCGHVVVELVKFIAYQRQQIPYSYPWLKQVITKMKSNEDQESKLSFQSERHFHTVSKALENLDFILKSLRQEISGPSIPNEVCIVLGGTPVMCKEVYRLILPAVCHKQQCHSSLIASDQKIQMKVFRNLVTEENLSQLLFNPLPPTNLYVFIKKNNIYSQDSIVSSDSFLSTNGCRIPRTSKIVVIDFRTRNKDGIKCCSELEIFGDNSSDACSVKSEIEEQELFEIESTDTRKWYQASYVMKGFKDYLINGSSITNTWLNS